MLAEDSGLLQGDQLEPRMQRTRRLLARDCISSGGGKAAGVSLRPKRRRDDLLRKSIELTWLDITALTLFQLASTQSGFGAMTLLRLGTKSMPSVAPPGSGPGYSQRPMLPR